MLQAGENAVCITNAICAKLGKQLICYKVKQSNCEPPPKSGNEKTLGVMFAVPDSLLCYLLAVVFNSHLTYL